ncbi:MAG: ribosomal protection-like ABC-F family protein, partial [Christensenellaceae bacterium]
MLISCDNLSFGYDGTFILERASFTVNENERIGLIGENGAGKTTFLRLLLGELNPDEGELFKKNALRIGYLAQSGGFDSDNSVYGEMLEVFRSDLEAIETLREVETAIAQIKDANGAEYRRLSAKYESLNRMVAARDAYNVEVRIRTVLNGMGFSDRYDQIISTMSGGEKTRLKLCRLLLEAPDLLILDEPTNHLDLKTLFWLEEYLASYKGAILTVSHDRYFLDKLVTKIFELEDKELVEYKGNYSKYKILKAERVLTRQREYEKQQVEIAHMQDYVDRNLVRATTAKSALSRVKKLEAMDRIEKPKAPSAPPKFRFTYAERPYERVLEVERLTLEAGGRTLLSDASLLITRGKKVALMGDNGTGKSTFIREIVKGNPAIRTARFTRIAYYDQENANLNPENTVLQELWERHSLSSQTEIRKLLARAKLDEEDVDKKVGQLSGGERAKLALAVFEAQEGNFLILDEPTNHLDLMARESLESALREFDGTILFVSHDRYLISAIADSIAEIKDGKLTF